MPHLNFGSSNSHVVFVCFMIHCSSYAKMGPFYDHSDIIFRAYFRGERNSLALEYYEGYFPFSHRLSANLILKSHKFHIFVIKRSVLGILHGNLSTNARQLTPKITAFDKNK